jgi:hypothetical protein
MDGETEQPLWVEGWGRRIDALGLSAVALVLIEAARPFGLLGSQMLLLAGPLLGGLVDDTAVARASALLDSPDLLNRLVACLEGGNVE